MEDIEKRRMIYEQNTRKNVMKAKQMACWLRVHTILSENQKSIPSSYSKSLIAAVNSTPWDITP